MSKINHGQNDTNSVARGPLPFGLGREARCSISSCQQPGVPLISSSDPLHDQVAQALSTLFSTFFATSLRYLGVSEILDWLHVNATVDAWLLTGFEGGRLPNEVIDERNLLVGKGAIKCVILEALAQDDEAWATSLREVGFSSGMSMAYEGIISQLKYSKASPLPCLHTLLTPTGLSMLKSAPLKGAFPICPPRDPPSPQPLLTSIKSLIASGVLKGPAWKQPSIWRPQVRRAFAAYHAMCKDVAEEIVSDPRFSAEYQIFLESISQPLQLLQLIAEDFDECFGPGACKGLLGVGDVGGQNLIQIMDFCAAKRPSELLARVKARVAEKQEREKVIALLARKRARLEEIAAQEATWAKEDLAAASREADVQDELRAATKLRRDALKKERATLEAAIQTLKVKEKDMLAVKEREKAARDAAAEVLGSVPNTHAAAKALGLSNRPADANGSTASAAAPQLMSREGSSKDLLLPTSNDPFAATAPRAISPSIQTSKGKAKAVPPPTSTRSPARYGPRGTAVPNLPSRSMSPIPLKSTKSRSASPVTSLKARNAAAAASLSTPPPSPPRLESPTPSHGIRRSLDDVRHRATMLYEPEVDDEDYDEDYDHDGEHGCAACAAALLDSTLAPVLAQRSLSASMLDSSAPRNGNSRNSHSDSLSYTADENEDRSVGDPNESLGAPPALETAKPTAMVETPTSTVNGNALSSPSSNKNKKKKKKSGANKSPGAASTAQTNGDPIAEPVLHKVASTPEAPAYVNSELAGFLVEGTIGLLPPSRPSVPKVCPPDRHCASINPDFAVWPQLDLLLIEVCLSGFKYELIDCMIPPLEAIRDRFAKQYLLSGGSMVDIDGNPRDMDEALRALTEPKLGMANMWSCLAQEDVQTFTQRILAISLRKLMDVFRAQLGELCICKLSNHPEVLATAHQRLTECETADRQIPIELPAMNQQDFMKWAHVQLREGKLGGPEWHGTERQYRLSDFLLSWSDAFDAALDRLIARYPYALAEDLASIMEWLGGVRLFDLAMRLHEDGMAKSQTDTRLSIKDVIETPEAQRPLREWNRAIKLGLKEVKKGKKLSQEVAEQQKQIGNTHFAAGEWSQALDCFKTAALIYPSDTTYWTNAAAARIKLGTRQHFSEAISDCTFALSLDSANLKALYRRGTALSMLGHWDKSVADLEQLVRLAPNESSQAALNWVRARRPEHNK